MSSLLSIRDLTVAYPQTRPVLEEVSLDISPGEMVGLCGPNGSGKTTLVRAASRSLRPLNGSVLFDGSDIWKLSARDFARQVAVVPQEIYTPFEMSALEIVLLGRHPHVGRMHLENSQDEDNAFACLAQVGVDHLAGRSIQRISGGERQRVIIAKALAQQPRLLILDEPTAHLDVAQQTEILSLVSQLTKDKGLTVVAVLHDLNLAAAWCQRLAVLHEGRIESDGTPNEVITEPLLAKVWNARMWVRHHPFTGRPFLLPMPPPFEPDDEAGQHELTVHVVCGGGSGGPVITSLMNEGWRVTCGVVNVGDSDEELCRTMNIPHVAEAPFSPISPDRAEANLKLAQAADLIILTDFCIGPGNIANLQTVLTALDAGAKIIRLEPSGDRATDYTGGQGEALLSQIIPRCLSVKGEAELVSQVRTLGSSNTKQT